MSNFNKIIIAGRLGGKPEITRVGEKQTSKVTFSVATKSGWGDKEETVWHRVIAWGARAEAIHQYLGKGDGILVEGEQLNRKYEKDGETKYISEINLNNFSFLDKKSDGAGGSGGQDYDLPY